MDLIVTDIDANQTLFVQESSNALHIEENERTIFDLYPIPVNDILHITPTSGSIIKSDGMIY